MSYDDPFFTVKEYNSFLILNLGILSSKVGVDLDRKIFSFFFRDIENNVATITTLFNSWNRIYNTVSSKNNEELKRAEEELKSSLHDITTDLDDVEETINILFLRRIL